MLPEIPTSSGSRPCSNGMPGGHRHNSSSATSRGTLGSAGGRRRDTPGSGEESSTSLPSIPTTPRDRAAASSAAPKAPEEGEHGQIKMKQFEENLAKFIKQGSGEDRERSRDRSSSAANSTASTPRGEKSRRRVASESSTSVLAAAYGVSPYLQEMKMPKKKMQLAEPSIDEAKGMRPEAAHRKKYLKMLRAMEEEAKRVKEEGEKKLQQQQQAAAKLRAKMGIDNVAPRLFEQPKRMMCEGEEDEEVGGGRRKHEAAEEEEEEDAEDPEKLAAKKAKAREAAKRNKAILERTQKVLAQMTEKRQQQEEEEEERRKREEKMREKLRRAAIEAAERAREEGEGEGTEGETRGRRRDADDDEDDGPASPKRGDLEKMIRNRTKRYQERFSSEAEEEAWLRKKYGFSDTDKVG